ncbi:hypothetical protein N0M98_17715 [Paenibacillus doosanensis]|uniref:hypothetical protein n=1 Tax=Paenibacillus doosanensis TaxID=1229154 RepID=UPI0021800600|nr:hypothetical protein [Paenibacillus doosanensis]MCS7461978.1 hypothetical protein [Paenibacillus doosanensis]
MIRNEKWELLENGVTADELSQWRETILEGGYSAFNKLLEGFKLQLKRMQDDEIEALFRWIECARRLFPEPGQFSPSWLTIWTELREMVVIKQQLMQTIPRAERDGEWQLILDNPFTIEEIVCHPGLTFDEASYLYSYFRPGLQKNEYIRLQKIQTLVTDVGS